MLCKVATALLMAITLVPIVVASPAVLATKYGRCVYLPDGSDLACQIEGSGELLQCDYGSVCRSLLEIETHD
jgi:hypothetical protein